MLTRSNVEKSFRFRSCVVGGSEELISIMSETAILVGRIDSLLDLINTLDIPIEQKQEKVYTKYLARDVAQFAKEHGSLSFETMNAAGVLSFNREEYANPDKIFDLDMIEKYDEAKPGSLKIGDIAPNCLLCPFPVPTKENKENKENEKSLLQPDLEKILLNYITLHSLFTVENRVYVVDFGSYT